ncbi:UvrY/SirA/GacA family response regulator transcription factor [soil metagenome]
MIRVFIVDDHPLVLEGIKSLLSKESGIEVAGYATNAQSCLGYFVNNTADVILMDINLPDMSGIDLCKDIKTKYPGIMILGLSTFNQGSYVHEMMKNGASGYVLKNADKEELLQAIHLVTQGKTYLSFEAGQAMWKQSVQSNNPVPQLSGREKEVLALIAEGYTNPEIAQKLYLSPSTIDSHRKNLLAKFGVKNTASLIRFAAEHKLI